MVFHGTWRWASVTLALLVAYTFKVRAGTVFRFRTLLFH